MDGWTDGLIGGQTTEGWMRGQRGGWEDGCTDGWMEGEDG